MLAASFIAIGALAYKAAAQTATFQNMTWTNVTVGQVWPISWTEGYGTAVSLYIGNTSWQWPIVGQYSDGFHRA